MSSTLSIYSFNLSLITNLLTKCAPQKGHRSLRDEFVKENGDFKLLLTKDGRKRGPFEEYRIYSVIRPYVYRSGDGKKVERTMWFLVVESTTLAKKEGKKIDTGIAEEEEKLTKMAKNWRIEYLHVRRMPRGKRL